MDRSEIVVKQRLDEIRQAIEELRTVAKAEHDVPRGDSADWLDTVFADITTPQELRAAAKNARTLYRQGMGGFSDVGSAGSAHAVDRLYDALRRASRTTRWSRSPD